MHLELTLRLRGGAQLGKAVKGRSKDRKDGAGGREATDEEKRLQDAIRRMEMSDYMKKLTQSKQALLREFLAREAAVSRTTKLKIQNHWRKIMRLVKVEALRKEVEVRAQHHERDVDRKDALVQLLDRDLDEAEEQFQLARRAHLAHMDALIDLQDERLLLLEREFSRELQALEREFAVERARIQEQHTRETKELNRVLAAVDQLEKEREAEARQEHEQLREEIRNKNLEDINVLRITLDSSIEELEQHFETAHLTYLQTTDQRTQDFKYLTAKDQELSRDIELKIRKMERLQAALAHWRAKIAQHAREGGERNRALEKEKAALSTHFQRLKAQMARMRDAHASRLAALATHARDAKKELDEDLALAERVLALGELARKLETEREHVLPFGDVGGGASANESLATDEDKKQARELTESVRRSTTTTTTTTATAGDLGFSDVVAEVGGERADAVDDDQDAPLAKWQPPAPLLHGTPVGEWDALENFWARFNKAQLDALALARAKARLERENGELRQILKQYLEGVSVSDAALAGANPLLVVNGRLRLHRAAGDSGTDRPKPVVDANHMVQTNRIAR
jgi:hypothetical protein